MGALAVPQYFRSGPSVRNRFGLDGVHVAHDRRSGVAMDTQSGVKLAAHGAHTARSVRAAQREHVRPAARSDLHLPQARMSAQRVDRCVGSKHLKIFP